MAGVGAGAGRGRGGKDNNSRCSGRVHSIVRRLVAADEVCCTARPTGPAGIVLQLGLHCFWISWLSSSSRERVWDVVWEGSRDTIDSPKARGRPLN